MRSSAKAVFFFFFFFLDFLSVCQDSYYLQSGQSINITSPNYPDVYPNGVVCTWSMRSSPEATLRMTYIDFQLEDLPFCSSDYVKFSFKREQECARMKVPHVYDTGQQEINITLVTDNVRAFKGFVINIMALQGKLFTAPFTRACRLSICITQEDQEDLSFFLCCPRRHLD